MNRNGLALLMVLGLLAMVTALLATWMVSASTLSGTWVVRDIEAQLLTQERSLEAVAISWLRKQGDRLVAPPDGGAWTILADTWTHDAHRGWATVTVYDGWAGIPVHLAGPRQPLRRFVPTPFLGLDYPATIVRKGVIEHSDFIERGELPRGSRRFPFPPHGPSSQATRWGQEGSTSELEVNLATPLPTIIEPSLAEVISPHSTGAINLNTAPLKLVEAVLRMQSGFSVQELRRNRQRGIMSPAPPGTDQNSNRPVLVASTSVWNVLITVGVGDRCRSWWAVVVVGTGNSLSILQRHAIDP